MTRTARVVGVVVLGALMLQGRSHAQPPAAVGTSSATATTESTAPALDAGESALLAKYLKALADKRLIAAESGTAAGMKALARLGEKLFLHNRFDEASVVLFEVAESPRFADFEAQPEFRASEYMLARSLAKLGALRTASRYFERVLARGPKDTYWGPTYRAYVDAALEGGELPRALARLEAMNDGVALPEDAQNELRYLQGRARYDAGDFPAAEQRFAEVTKNSRFYASAYYLRGVMAAQGGKLKDAENLFCEIAAAGKDNKYSFYVDERYFDVKDLAYLALGRVAHEGGRAEDAFYYYFQVPQDSDRVAEALFESAYAMYEGGDHDTAIDLLDQLDSKFPDSSFVDEAKLLRGYVHLSRCEFDEADKLFVAFHRRFQPVLDEADRILASPALQDNLYESLLAEERYEAERRAKGEKAEPSAASLLLAMLRVNPEFYRLHADVRTLDAEAARAGRLGVELGAIGARAAGGDAPKAAAKEEASPDESAELRADLASARSVLKSLAEQLDALRRSKADVTQTGPLDLAVRDLGKRIDQLESRTSAEIAKGADTENASATDASLDALLAADVANASHLPARVEAVREKLVLAANGAALSSIKDLRARLGKGLRRARIGRIDAVMGSKHRVEIQIESLAAGRFPAELMDPLRMQGLLRDDEEYWPFEGEYWSDEFVEGEPLETPTGKSEGRE